MCCKVYRSWSFLWKCMIWLMSYLKLTKFIYISSMLTEKNYVPACPVLTQYMLPIHIIYKIILCPRIMPKSNVLFDCLTWKIWMISNVTEWGIGNQLVCFSFKVFLLMWMGNFPLSKKTFPVQSLYLWLNFIPQVLLYSVVY